MTTLARPLIDKSTGVAMSLVIVIGSAAAAIAWHGANIKRDIGDLEKAIVDASDESEEQITELKSAIADLSVNTGDRWKRGHMQNFVWRMKIMNPGIEFPDLDDIPDTPDN